MADKKPVWVDEDAHAILKAYSAITKESMVEIASRLVVDHLAELEAGFPAEAAAPAAAAAAEPAKAERSAPRAAARPIPVEPPRSRTENDGVRYLGGVWLV
jgi:hypothetical protein